MFGKKRRYLLVYLVLVVTMGWLFVRMPTAYLPQEDQGVMYTPPAWCGASWNRSSPP